jgi:hypothetical protein
LDEPLLNSKVDAKIDQITGVVSTPSTTVNESTSASFYSSQHDQR